MNLLLSCLAWLFVLSTFAAPPAAKDLTPESFTVGTFNLEMYLDGQATNRFPKTAESKARVRESIRALNADVLAVEEMGSPRVFEEFRSSLKADGMDYPAVEYIQAADSMLHVAILSRFPIVARRSHTNDAFLLNGRRFRVLRGFAEVDVRVGPRFQFTLLAAHLKSRRLSAEADEADIREQEALLLRQKVDAILRAQPNANLVVVGDLNDNPDSKSVRTIIGKGKTALMDCRPFERNGDSYSSQGPFPPRRVAWTHFFGKEDVYSRVDYALISPAMVRRWQVEQSSVLSLPNWGEASDHRPVVVSFQTGAR